MSGNEAVGGYVASKTKKVDAANRITYAYRELGRSEVPVVCFQHFRGNPDNWDPALIDPLAANRRVITFNNTGVASTTGLTPHTFAEMARDAIERLDRRPRSSTPPLAVEFARGGRPSVAARRDALPRRWRRTTTGSPSQGRLRGKRAPCSPRDWVVFRWRIAPRRPATLARERP